MDITCLLFIWLVRCKTPPWCLKSVPSDGAQTAAGDAGEAGGRGGELRVRAAETLWGVNGAQAEAGVPEHEGHDGQRVRATGKDASFMEFNISEMLCVIKTARFFSLHFLDCRTKESIGRQEKLKEEQRHRMKVGSSDHKWHPNNGYFKGRE